VAVCSDPLRSEVLHKWNERIDCRQIVNGSDVCPDTYAKPKYEKMKALPLAVSEAVFLYARSNLAVVKVFIKDPYYTLIINEEQVYFFLHLNYFRKKNDSYNCYV
jgi:hypothetical protein